MSGSHVIRYKRMRRGKHYADFMRDKQLTPEVYHCVVQRDGSPEILWWSQFNWLGEAIEAAKANLQRLSRRQSQSVA